MTDERETLDTLHEGLAPAPESRDSSTMRAARLDDAWTPIEGAPDWMQEKDRRDHASSRLILGEVHSLVSRVHTVEGRVHGHDLRLAQLESENQTLRRENRELRKDLARHIQATADDGK